MVSEYNYSVMEVGRRRADQRSYLCYPMVDENHNVLGLLYFDSNIVSTFTMDEANPRWQAIRKAAEIIHGNILFRIT